MARVRTSISNPTTLPTISRRAYNALTYGMVAVSFLVLWGTYLFAQGGGLSHLFTGGKALPVTIGSFVITIVGLLVMGWGKSKQSIPITLVGYVIFMLTFGISISFALQRFNIGTIYYAFGITACISAIFLIAGVTFPEFFSRIGGVLFISLFALIIVEFVAVFLFHANQTIFDWIGIFIFCGFLGYDSYVMSSDEPTVSNAIFHAVSIYIDIVNILLRVLDLLDSK